MFSYRILSEKTSRDRYTFIGGKRELYYLSVYLLNYNLHFETAEARQRRKKV